MLLLALGILILLYACVDYKKALMLFLGYQLFMYDSANLIIIAGHTLTIQIALVCGFFILFFFKNRKLTRPNVRIPYRIPMIALCFSCFVTSLISLDGFLGELLTSINSYICPGVILIWLIWNTIETNEDFKFLFKVITVIMFAACLLGLIEYATKTGYLYDYKESNYIMYISNYNTSSAVAALARGYRLYSIFEHPIGGGMCFGLYAAFAFTLIIKNKEKWPFRRLSLLTALLCILCVFLTKMRSAMIFTFIACLACIDFKKKKFYGIILICAIGVVAVWPLLSQYAYVILSIFDSSYQSSVVGSSLSMRLNQFAIAFKLWKMSPIAGLGGSYQDYLSYSLYSGIYGSESVWLVQLASYGTIGIISTMINIVYSVVLIPKKYHSKEIFFISLAYWVTYTITSLPSFRLSLYYIVLFYFIKKSEVYQRSCETIRMKSFSIRIR